MVEMEEMVAVVVEDVEEDVVVDAYADTGRKRSQRKRIQKMWKKVEAASLKPRMLTMLKPAVMHQKYLKSHKTNATAVTVATTATTVITRTTIAADTTATTRTTLTTVATIVAVRSDVEVDVEDVEDNSVTYTQEPYTFTSTDQPYTTI